MPSSAVSARARVAPPDPNDIPLEPEPPTATELAEQAAREQAMREQAAREQAMREQAAYQQAMREQAAREQAAHDQAAYQQTMQEQAAREQAMREQAARDQAMREQAARDQAMREQAARDQAVREQYARNQPGPAPQFRPANAYPPRASATVEDNNAWSRVPPPSESVPAPAPPPQRRSATRVAMIAGLLVIVLLAGGFIAVRVWPSGAKAALAASPSFAPPGTVLGVLSDDAPMPSPAGVEAALSKPLHSKALGPHVSVQVTDLSTGSVLFSQNQFSPTTPASSMKLATCLSLLELRGPYYRITTHAVAGHRPGEVVLVGAGDPTLAAKEEGTYRGSGRLVDLANQVKVALGDVKPTKVIIDTSLFTGPTIGPGWEKSDVHSSYATSVLSLTTDGGRIHPSDHGSAKRYDDPAAAAGAIFARYLGLPATAVAEGEAPAAPAATGDPTAPGAVLGSVRSAPLVRIIETMLAESDNMLAEFMARQVAIAMGEPVSFAGAARAVTEELTKLGMPMRGVHIVDGSGLSPLDKLTPALLSAVLAFAASPANLKAHALFTGMPVAGWSGTLSGRFKRSGTTAGQGLIRAKTGTLTGVSALAGTMVDSSGRVLIFVLLVDKVPWGASVQPAIDRVGAAVWRCGCG